MRSALRSRRTTVVAMLGLLTGVGAYLGYQAFARPTRPAPELFHRTESVGPILARTNELYTHTFEVVNPSSQTVHMGEVVTGCACKQPVLADWILPPRGKTKLSVSFLLGPPTGLRPIHCVLRTDYPDVPEWHYHANVSVYAAHAATPDHLSFGTIKAGTDISLPFTLESYRPAGSSAAILDIVHGKRIQVTLEDKTEEEAPPNLIRSLTRYRVELLATHDPGDYVDNVTIWDPADMLFPAAGLAVYWHVPSVIEVAPSSGAFFGKVENNSRPAELTVILRSFAGPFRILGTKSQHYPAITVDYSPSSKTVHTCTVRLDPSRIIGVTAGEITLDVEHAEQRQVSIKYAAMRD
jgi:hypothetical protein